MLVTPPLVDEELNYKQRGTNIYLGATKKSKDLNDIYKKYCRKI